MREILSRAKRKDNGEWTEGYVFELQPGQYMICDRIQYDRPSTLPVWEFFRYCSHEIDPETLCRYTGLKDKNGNRIWENDILQNARNNDLYTVKWHGSFGMYVWSKRKENNKHIFDYGDLYLMNRKCVVIGNIFDDPELLKGE